MAKTDGFWLLKDHIKKLRQTESEHSDELDEDLREMFSGRLHDFIRRYFEKESKRKPELLEHMSEIILQCQNAAFGSTALNANFLRSKLLGGEKHFIKYMLASIESDMKLIKNAGRSKLKLNDQELKDCMRFHDMSTQNLRRKLEEALAQIKSREK